MEASRMTESRGVSRSRQTMRGAVHAMVAAVVAAQLVSCAGKPGSVRDAVSERAATAQEASARDLLAALAAKQVQTPDARATAVWRELPGLDVASMEASATSDSGKTLAQLVADVPTVAPAQPAEIDDASLAESQRLYVQGKSLLLDGEIGQALQAMETALRLHPASQELLCEVGEMQLRAGRRLQGVASLRRAATQGAIPARAAWLLGREELRQDDAAAALPHLLRAHRDVSVMRTPVLGAAVHAELARALIAQGHLAAANEALAISLEAPVEQFAVTIDSRDFGEVMRDRPALTMLRGDLASRIERYDVAVEAYTQAANMAGIDPATPFLKLLATQLRQGRSAEAATGLLRHIDARRGVVDESLEKAATLLAQRTDVGQLLIQAMTQSSDGARTASVQHRLARLAAGAAATPQEARAVLTGAVRTSGVDVATIATLLDTYPSGEASAKLSALTSIVAEQPLGADAAAEALLETGRDVAATLAVARDASNIESRMVAAATLRRLGRVRDAKTVLADVNLSQASRDMALGVVASRAANAGAAGDPVAARELAATITGDSALAARTKALCEIAAGNAAGARAALDPLIRGELAGVSVDDYLLAADLALRENASGEVPALLAKARDLDASDERVHEAFAALYSPQGAMPNEQLLGETMREMRAAIPGSQLLRLLIAQDQAQRGLWRQAMPNLQALVNERGRPAEALDSLVRVWERNADDATLAEAERLLQARLANRPESTPWMLAYSRVLMRNKKTAEADNLLAAGIESLQSEMLMRQREFVLREGLKQPEAADALMQQRLALAPPTLANKLELATIAARQGRGLDALRELAEAAPLAGTMQLPQARNVVALVSNVKPEELRELSQHESEGIVQFMEAARKLQRFAPASELARAQLLAQARPGNSAELLALCKELQPVSEQIATFAIVRIVETLRARPDHSPLIRFLGTFALDAETPDPGLVNEWLVRTAVRGNLDDARFLIDNVRDLELASTIVAQYSDAELPNELPRAKAEVAYVLSNLATSVMRDAMSNTCLELCLSLHPKHPWAANNLAYQMLEHGGDMQRIESLVEVAYSQLSDEASVIDTKGWLRYKQGQLDDVQLADGTVREGAITLIERAVTMVEARGDDNAELYDHLGDALWQRDRAAQGGELPDRARAVELWRKAIKSLDEELVMRRNIELPGLPRVAEIEAHRNRVENKRLAAETSGQPAVSPMSVPPTLTPRPEPAPIDIDAIWNLNRQRQLQE